MRCYPKTPIPACDRSDPSTWWKGGKAYDYAGTGLGRARGRTRHRGWLCVATQPNGDALTMYWEHGTGQWKGLPMGYNLAYPAAGTASATWHERDLTASERRAAVKWLLMHQAGLAKETEI